MDVVQIRERLAEPFPLKSLGFKPQAISGSRALPVAYIDARDVMDRLDEALGVENWEDVYEVLPEGSVVCRLRCRIGDVWITKADVGSPSEQPDPGDRLKAAFSDALKRAAVKYGIGRYLYALELPWADFDAQKKKFVSVPVVPASFLPRPKQPQKHEPPSPPPPPQQTAPPPPATGEELLRRLRDYEVKLAAQKRCKPGELVSHLTALGIKAGFTADMKQWTGPAIQFAIDAVREFERTKPEAPAAGASRA